MGDIRTFRVRLSDFASGEIPVYHWMRNARWIHPVKLPEYTDLARQQGLGVSKGDKAPIVREWNIPSNKDDRSTWPPIRAILSDKVRFIVLDAGIFKAGPKHNVSSRF